MVAAYLCIKVKGSGDRVVRSNHGDASLTDGEFSVLLVHMRGHLTGESSLHI